MAAWLVIAGLLCLLFVVMEALALSEALALLLPLALLYAFMCLASLYLCRSFPLQKTAFMNVAGVVVASSMLSAALWLAVGKGIALLLERLDFFSQLSTKYDAGVPLLFGIGMLLFALSIVVHYLLLAFDSARAAERQALELQVIAREAELKALRSQIQPHFLFNSLNSISALTASDPVAARAMALKLAEFFRKTLNLGQQQFIPLGEELQLVEHFLAIEQTRFGHRLKYDRAIEEDCEQLQVPSLILQPLIENAINHGIAHLVEGGVISVSAKRNSSTLSLTIRNPTDEHSPRSKSTAVGLTIVRKRLETLYGNEARMSVEKKADFFQVEIVLPERLEA